MPKGKLKRITFSDNTAIAFIEKAVKGTRKTARCSTRGRGGTKRIPLWRELCDIMVHKEVVIEADLDDIRAALGKNELPSFADVRSIWPGELLSFVASLLISLRCSCRGEYVRPERRRHCPCCKSAASRSCCHPTAEAAVSTHNANERRRRLLIYPSTREDSRSAQCSSCSSRSASWRGSQKCVLFCELKEAQAQVLGRAGRPQRQQRWCSTTAEGR